jgi:hypothetical protein
LIALVNRQPFQTRAQKPPQPFDITALMLIGSQARVEGAFADAGWTQASKVGEKSKFETMRAVAEDRGYSEAPVSILYLDGRPPPRTIPEPTFRPRTAPSSTRSIRRSILSARRW